MAAQDASFNELNEELTATSNVPAEPGLYRVCVRGRDAPDNSGGPGGIVLMVYDPESGFVTVCLQLQERRNDTDWQLSVPVQGGT